MNYWFSSFIFICVLSFLAPSVAIVNDQLTIRNATMDSVKVCFNKPCPPLYLFIFMYSVILMKFRLIFQSLLLVVFLFFLQISHHCNNSNYLHRLLPLMRYCAEVLQALRLSLRHWTVSSCTWFSDLFDH